MRISTLELPYCVDGKAFDGFMADGSGGTPAPGVLVAHEGRGFSQHARDRAVMLAELGYVAYAPDYFGEAATSLEHAFELMKPFAEDRGKFHRHGLAAIDVLCTHSAADRARLAAIGFCWGAYAILELACVAPLRCITGFHPGLSLGPLTNAKAISGSVQLCVGDRDPYVPLSDVTDTLAFLHDAGVDCQVLILSGAPHSFTNPEPYIYETGTENVGYDAKADRRAWAAMLGFFAEYFNT